MNLNNVTSEWLAIAISSILFALIHLPSIKLVASKPKKSMYVYAIIGNIWVGIFAGVAFVYGSLLAAIIVHMLFHLLWWPIQTRENAKLP
ncbi:CPBP family intramembrane glutamic endopeptidase [Lysinibacillus pakistanensis]